MSQRTTSIYKSTTQVPENNLHNNHSSSNLCKNNSNREHNEEKQLNHNSHLVPPQEELGTTAKAVPIRPPPGLEQVPAQPPGPLGATSKAPLERAPPQPVRPQPIAGPQQHRPVGKHYNPARPRPQQAGAILQQPTDMNNDTDLDSYDCYNLTMETKVLHLAVNEDKKEKLLQQELMLDHAVLLPSYHYHDNIEQYDKQEVLTAMKKELDKLRQKDMYEECDKSTLSPEQLRKVVKTRWVVGDRPDPTTTATTGEVHASELRARFVAKGYSQHVDDPMVECYAATPSSTSLKTLLLLRILQGHQTTCLDISTAFINTPLPPTEEIYVQPPAEWYYNSPTTLWRLKKAMYGLTYKSEALATTLGGSTTPTKSTTMQGRPLPLDYTWIRSFDPHRRLVVGWRDYKDTIVHLYSEGYFHVEACDYTFQRARCSLFGKETTTS